MIFSSSLLENAVNEFFGKEEKKKERKIILKSYCKGRNMVVDYGNINNTNLTLCGDPDCYQCRNLEKLFDEVFRNEIKKYII